MTDIVVAGTLTSDGHNRWDNDNPNPMPKDFWETRRTADIRSPLRGEFSLATVMDEVLGRESATCEACQRTVDPNVGGDLEGSDPFIIGELVENVNTLENQVLLCEACANRPTDEWRTDVREKRAQERDYTPTWTEHIAHWVSDPTATSVFARRVVATVAGTIALYVIVTTVAGIVGSLTADVATGVAWARTVVMVAAIAFTVMTDHPWFTGSLVGMAYTAHAIERVHYDPRGYLSRDHPPWVLITVAGVISAVGSFGLLGVAMEVMPATQLTYPFAVTVWAIGAAGVAWYIDLALRHDLSRRIWNPSRGVWMVAGRVGILPGVLAITVGVPFPGVFADTATGVLAGIPAGVALAFTARRLPYDTQTRDRILGLMPQWLLERRRSD